MGKSDVTATLLVGLGGLGSSIVNRIYGEVKKNGQDKKVEAVIIDTDIGSLNKNTNIDPIYRIQTSENSTVKGLLDRDPSCKEWFPEHPVILNSQILEGAGMVRAISRLALKNAIKSNKLSVLNQIGDNLFEVGNETTTRGIRVMIISSLMGGTGSGIFLQVPLLLRDILENKYGTDRIDIMGTFILPDVISKVIPTERKTDIYANAYASFKELQAIITSLTKNEFGVDLEYKPEQVNSEGIRNITVDRLPYDFCYLYDSKNMNSEVLSTLDDYLDLIIRDVYAMLFGPISDGIFSKKINTIRELIKGQGQNLYSAMGDSMLVYSYEDMVNYCSLSWISNSLSENMLKLDNEYKKLDEEYRKNQRKGIVSPKVERSKIFVDCFENLVKEENNYFKGIMNSIVYKDPVNPALSYDKPVDMLKAFDAKIMERIETDMDVAPIQAEIKKNINFIANMNDVGSNDAFGGRVRMCEDNIVKFKNIVETAAKSKCAIDVKGIAGLIDDSPNGLLYDYMHNGNEFIHVLGVRYLMYKVKYLAASTMNKLSEEVNRFAGAYARADKGFTMKDKGNGTASQKLNEVQNEKGLFNRRINNFKKEYIDNANAKASMIRKYYISKRKLESYKVLVEIIDGVSKEFENFFEHLKAYEDTINISKEKEYNKTNNQTGKTVINVLAKGEEKEAIYNQIEGLLDFNSLQAKLASFMFESIFKNYKVKLNNANIANNTFGKTYTAIEEEIMKNCRQELIETARDVLDIDIVDALIKEANLNGIDYKENIENKLKQICRLVSPWIITNDNVKTHDDIIFAMNPKTYEKLPDKGIISTLLKDKGNVSAEQNSEVSEKEISLVMLKYGMKITDIKGFSSTASYADQGEMFKAYNEVIKQIQDSHASTILNRVVTPHIDKRWHVMLPSIDQEYESIKQIEQSKAYLAGLALGMFKIRMKTDGTNNKTFLFYSPKNTIPAKVTIGGIHGMKEITDSYWELLDAVKYNPQMSRTIMDKYNEELEASNNTMGINVQNIVDLPIIASLCDIYRDSNDNMSVIDAMISAYSVVPATEKQSTVTLKKITELIKALENIIEENVKIFALSEIQKDEMFNKVLNHLLSKSRLVENLSEDTIENVYIVEPIKNLIRG